MNLAEGIAKQGLSGVWLGLKISAELLQTETTVVEYVEGSKQKA